MHAVSSIDCALMHLQQNDIKKFVKLCAVLSDIQSLISKEDKIANISETNNQRVSFEAAVAVSKAVEMNMCNWVSLASSADSYYHESPRKLID